MVFSCHLPSFIIWFNCWFKYFQFCLHSQIHLIATLSFSATLWLLFFSAYSTASHLNSIVIPSFLSFLRQGTYLDLTLLFSQNKQQPNKFQNYLLGLYAKDSDFKFLHVYAYYLWYNSIWISNNKFQKFQMSNAMYADPGQTMCLMDD